MYIDYRYKLLSGSLKCWGVHTLSSLKYCIPIEKRIKEFNFFLYKFHYCRI